MAKKHKQKWSLKKKYPNLMSDSEASLIVKDLVQTHPHEAMRRHLDYLVSRGIIFLNFQDGIGGQNTLATVVYANTPTHGTVLALSISKKHLVDPATPKIFKQLVIFHEWHHLRQQLDRTKPEWLAMGVKDPGMMTEEMIRIFFEAEMEAYLPECELAVELDAIQTYPLYAVFANGGVSELRRHLAEVYAQMPRYSKFAALFRSIAWTPTLT